MRFRFFSLAVTIKSQIYLRRPEKTGKSGGNGVRKKVSSHNENVIDKPKNALSKAIGP